MRTVARVFLPTMRPTLAAAAVIDFLPTIVIVLALQRSFAAGTTGAVT